MSLELLGTYNSLIVDYSIIREFAGTSLFSRFLSTVVSNSQDVYVSKAFKLQHYCVIHQADDKHIAVAAAMKEFCGVLLANQKLHTVQAVSASDFISKLPLIPGACIVTTSRSIFAKRVFELNASSNTAVAILSSDGVDLYENFSDLITNMPQLVISPLASQNKYLDVPVYCNVGDVISTGNKGTVTLEKRISSGAEGMVFTTDNPKYVAKIYHKGVITPLRWSKLTKMVSMGINSVGICWPHDLLFYKGVPVGYTMITGKGKTLGNVFDGPDAMMNNFPKWKRVDIVDTLIDLIEKYLYLHMHDIVAGDIQLKNALLYSSNSVYLIDMDSVQVANLPCPVGTEEFTDPRLWGKNFAGFLRNLEDEDYSIAMLVFSTLFCGLHPYATRKGAETLREEILGKNFPYTLDNSDEEHIPLGGYNHIWNYLSEDLRNKLYRVFKLGERVEAIDWYDSVLAYKEMLTSHKFADEEAYKVFPKMDYKMTEEATEDTPVKKPIYQRNKFAINGPGVYTGGLGNVSPDPNPLGNANRNTTSNNSGSPFVPKGQGNVPSQNKPTPTPPPTPEKEGGFMKKFKKGLFGS